MNTSMLLILALLFMAMAFTLGRKRSIAVAGGSQGIRNLNSLPGYYGTLSALWCGIPSILILVVWVLFDDFIIQQIIIQELPSSTQALSESELGLLLNTVSNMAINDTSTLSAEPYIIAAAERLNGLQ
jgi:phosphate transport system permease protein